MTNDTPDTGSPHWRWRIGHHRAIESTPPPRAPRTPPTTDQIDTWAIAIGAVGCTLGMMLIALHRAAAGSLPETWQTVGACSLLIGACAFFYLGATWWLSRSYRSSDPRDGMSPWGRR